MERGRPSRSYLQKHFIEKQRVAEDLLCTIDAHASYVVADLEGFRRLLVELEDIREELDCKTG